MSEEIEIEKFNVPARSGLASAAPGAQFLDESVATFFTASSKNIVIDARGVLIGKPIFGQTFCDFEINLYKRRKFLSIKILN